MSTIVETPLDALKEVTDPNSKGDAKVDDKKRPATLIEQCGSTPKVLTAGTMKALTFENHGTPAMGALSVGTVPKPIEAPAGYVLIKVMAAALNPVDKVRVEGGLRALVPEASYPAVLGSDLAGIIEKVGDANGKFAVGDRVAARQQDYPYTGCIGEYCLVDVSMVAKVPAKISFTDAASVGMAGQIALQALRKGNVTTGSKVFVSGGAGGVGTLGIQIAKILGASSVATTASAGAKTDLVKSLGADVVVDYKSTNFEEVLEGYDVAFDTTNESAKCAAILTPNADKQVITIAGLPTSGTSAAEKAAVALGCKWTHLFMNTNGTDMEWLIEHIADGKLRPIIDSTFPLSRATEAAERSFSGRAAGKVVIDLAA